MSADLEQSTGVRNPLTLLQAMIDKGADPEKLGRMIDLAEKWQANQARIAFALAMNRCQQELPRVIKTTKGQNSVYAALETIQDAISSAVLANGFSLSWGSADSQDPEKTRVVCTLYHIGGHQERYQGDYPIDGRGAKGGGVMNALQGTVSAHTYAQRDMLRLIFNLTIAGQDRDGSSPLDTIDQDDVAQLNTLIEEKGVDFDAFLRFALRRDKLDGDESMDQILKADMPKLLDMLRRRKKGTVKS